MEKFINGLSDQSEVGSDVMKFLQQSFSEIEHKQRNLALTGESVVERMVEIETLRESYEKGSKDLEEKELDFCKFKEGEKRKLALEEGELSVQREKLLNDVRIKEEKMNEELACLHEKINLMEVGQKSMQQRVGEKLKEIEVQEQRLDSAWDSLSERERKIDGIARKIHRHASLVEERENALNSKIEDAKLRDKELTKREKLVNQLFEKLNLVQDNVERLKEAAHEKFKQVGLKEIEVKSTRDWVEKKKDELDSRSAELEKKEENLISKEIKLEEKLKELEVKLREVDSVQELNQRRLEELDRKEKSLNSVKKLTSDCFKEHIAIKKQLLLEKDLIKRREKDFDFNESVDIKFILRMDGRTLQMFLNDPKKDLESMGDEIFQVLHLSCDPAKLILDAMVGFYPPHLRKGDVEIDVRRTCIILLEQLGRMTKRIQPNTRKEAIELASSWKSKMGASGEDPLEVLGFLYLLAAYNIASYFDKNEILGFLKITDQLRQRHLQFRVFGFEDIFTDSSVKIER